MNILKEIALEIFILLTKFIMWLPIAPCRNIFLKLVLKRYYFNSYIKRDVFIRKPSNIIVGQNVCVNSNVFLDGRGGLLSIGDSTDIAQGVYIYTLTHNVNDVNHSTIGKNVFIGDHVWIGAKSIILPGVTIGRGSVIGCGSVVSKNVGENEIVAGVPARFIKYRVNNLDYKIVGNNLFL